MFGWFKKKLEVVDTVKQTVEEKVETIIEEVKKEINKKEVVEIKKPNHFADCNCIKCERWRQNAK
jgi:nucleoid DNA-binding protein